LRLREDVDLFAEYYGPGQDQVPGEGVENRR
jgi:hypothetical protein